MPDEVLRGSLQRLGQAAARAAARVQKLDGLEGLASQATLKELVERRLKGRPLLMASNREPWVHRYQGDEVTHFRAAGGLTIALDSLAAACGATWVCHGGGDADFTVTDEKDHVAVPPGKPTYRLRRLRLSREEERGYYEGFSNETLWPLCHVSYVRPKFSLKDWHCYQSVNAKFADALAEEAPEGAVVFLQDYHLALVGRLLKEKRPDLVSVLFWHIPWPNPEIFRICPWKKELLEGLLGNDILGFHLRYHADNFMETVGMELECQLDWEKLAVRRSDRLTRVRAYPISVDFESIYLQAESREVADAVERLRRKHRLSGQKVALGVDRLDYTKGIPERLMALERLFELHPEWIGRLKLLQIGVPSRTHLEDYQNVVADIERRCEALNARFGQDSWQPVTFMKGHQDFDTLIPYYKMADLCLVSSLHDGMNLVAKEFVAASSNDRGVLVLSPFTGAARELEQALLVNPYDTEEFAEALHRALSMPQEEQRARLERMRRRVAENNIYTWSQAIFSDVVGLAEDAAVPAPGSA